MRIQSINQIIISKKISGVVISGLQAGCTPSPAMQTFFRRYKPPPLSPPGRPSEGLAYAAGPGSGDGVGEEEGKEQDGGARTETLGDEVPWAYTSDDSVAFSLDCVVQGDLLVRSQVWPLRKKTLLRG